MSGGLVVLRARLGSHSSADSVLLNACTSVASVRRCPSLPASSEPKTWHLAACTILESSAFVNRHPPSKVFRHEKGSPPGAGFLQKVSLPLHQISVPGTVSTFARKSRI